MTTPSNENFNVDLSALYGRLILQTLPATIRRTVVNAFKFGIYLNLSLSWHYSEFQPIGIGGMLFFVQILGKRSNKLNWNISVLQRRMK